MSDPQTTLRQDALELLSGGGAHASFERATADLPADRRGARAENQPHTPWRLVEHVRIAQHDILKFITEPAHDSPPWPDGYWPDGDAPPHDGAWDHALAQFHADAAALAQLVENPETDLLAPLPHGSGQTILREVMLLADHNSYHIGQLILLRRLLDTWEG